MSTVKVYLDYSGSGPKTANSIYGYEVQKLLHEKEVKKIQEERSRAKAKEVREKREAKKREEAAKLANKATAGAGYRPKNPGRKKGEVGELDPKLACICYRDKASLLLEKQARELAIKREELRARNEGEMLKEWLTIKNSGDDDRANRPKPRVIPKTEKYHIERPETENGEYGYEIQKGLLHDKLLKKNELRMKKALAVKKAASAAKSKLPPNRFYI